MQETEPRRTPVGDSIGATLAGRADEFVARLASDAWADRCAGEEGLRNMGAAAVPTLVAALRSNSDQVRWGAAKVLSEMSGSSAIPALVEALEDADGGVRWLAAQALIWAGPRAQMPLLRELLTKADSPWRREGAHHVLRALPTTVVSPVIQALEDHFPEFGVPLAASEALKTLESGLSA